MRAMKMPEQPFRLVLSVALAACLAGLASVGGIHARQTAEDAAASSIASDDEEYGDDVGDMAWVDPVITGPVSPDYRRVREAAGCDTAIWPDIPDVCYPK
jgi:predicted DNA-binding transcriptional regulator YafY